MIRLRTMDGLFLRIALLLRFSCLCFSASSDRNKDGLRRPPPTPPKLITDAGQVIPLKMNQELELFCSGDGNVQTIVSYPPRITRNPPQEIGYKVWEELTITCEAVGPPQPSYEWTKDGKPLTIDGVLVKQATDHTGTISIPNAKLSDEGTYQCFAKNSLGRAVSVKTVVRRAYLDAFPTIKAPHTHRVKIGESLTLTCNPPRGYPEGIIYWGELRAGERATPVDDTKRFSIDYDGHLHFSNIEAGDSRGGLTYVCIVQNIVLRNLVQGNDQIIVPLNITGAPVYANPRVMWNSNTKEKAIRSEKVKMKCIFSGFPTPTVSWTRVGSELSSRARTDSSYGQELVIYDVEFSDEGRYQCSASNAPNGKSITITFDLTVESLPYWRHDRPPQDETVGEGDDAQFRCVADGIPKPSVSWYINGEPLTDLPRNKRIRISGGELDIRNVSRSDIQVIQCNASNIHGYILANAYLNVLTEPPGFLEVPQEKIKVAVGQNVTLPCKATGTKPVIKWKTPVVKSERHIQRTVGDLFIRNVQLSDDGEYQCEVVNKYGNDTAKGRLFVRERTEIIKLPVSQTVNVSSPVVFECGVRTDPQEMKSLRVDWRRNGVPIDLRKERSNLLLNEIDNSLMIRAATVANSANYTCHADNGIDQDEVTATLVVKDRPDAPYSVRLVRCSPSFAEITWIGGNENNDDIIDYTVYCNTSDDTLGEYQEVLRTHGPETTGIISLGPWTNYTFHVIARNRLGTSDRSSYTSTVCSTPAQPPSAHPTGVCSRSGEPNQLVIVWKPIDKRYHNGPNFRYLVTYRRVGERRTNGTMGGKTTGGSDASEEHRNVSDWRQFELVVKEQPTYTRYEISVGAVNSEGFAESSPPSKCTGYSSEGVPAVSPRGFALASGSLNATSARFVWNPVEDNPETVRGFLRGYQIRFWKTGSPNGQRIEDVILREPEACPCTRRKKSRRRHTDNIASERLTRAVAPLVRGETGRLWPYSKITAGVVILNGAFPGPLSETIEFHSPEGVPSEVAALSVGEKGSHHFVVNWSPPNDVNGVLKDYVVRYREVSSNDQFTESIVDDVSKTKTKLVGLRPDTKYEVQISATTAAGEGSPRILNEQTVPNSAPDRPLVNVKPGENSAEVLWTPSTKQRPSNPGASFKVKLRPRGSSDWLEPKLVDNEQNRINITNLETGEYELQVIALNGEGVETASDIIRLPIGVNQEPVVATSEFSQWLIILLCVLAAVVLILVLLICWVRHNAGEQYLVNKSERLNGCDPDALCDGLPIGEYVRCVEPELNNINKASSVNSLEKPAPESDDSLAEYGDPDPSKFNEDGSFIGQYGGKVEPPQPEYGTAV